MITRVQVKNFRNLADIDVELGPLTVLVGRNCAGKSTFLDVLKFVRDALQYNLEFAIQQRGGIGALRRWQPGKAPSDITINLTLNDENVQGEYSFRISSGEKGEYRVVRERYAASMSNVIDPTSGKPEIETYETVHGRWLVAPRGLFPSIQIAVGNPQEQMMIDRLGLTMSALATISPIMSQFQRRLINVHAYNIYPNSLREPQKPASERVLGDNGQNMATVLQALRLRKQDYGELISALAHVVPGVNDVLVQQIGEYLVTKIGQQQPGGETAWFDFAQSSDGTLRMLALLVALYQDAGLTLTAIEEPELALHPGALAVLSEIIREASLRTQVIITTQSPDLISQFNADELRVVEQTNEGAQIGPIDERQREIINEQLFSAGDLLRIEGLHSKEEAEVAA
jgi:predicted ATPase